MKPTQFLIVAVAATALTVTGVKAFSGSSQDGGPPELPENLRQSGIELLVAQPFTLAEEVTHYYRAEQPTYTSGHLLVLAVDRDLSEPRQGYEPVLYVGGQTAERVNTGAGSGNLVVIVPSLDLEDAPIFWGDANILPEAVDAQRAADEARLAREAGIEPVSSARLAQVMREEVALVDGYDLHLFASYLVEEFAPIEVDLISGLRAPLIGR